MLQSLFLDDVYYHGHITEFEEERDGFWVRLDDDPDRENFFHFGDIDTVFNSDKIASLEDIHRENEQHNIKKAISSLRNRLFRLVFQYAH
ncbi:hypothetical protein [Bacillus sp. ISL-7]|uniref:hypothetical protein n=1 Tax=Bacillus sp. ISL-7 TaxID=2819136 RepID=UPI001BECDD7C|nr:hypothetical protein [Bacillus sp. ISL-7]MBT2739039.1 hypothetical protein [Bacillus sp. ISL-7]